MGRRKFTAAFSKPLRARLLDRASGFAKDYLRALVDEIRVEGNAATISGSYERLIAAAVKEKEDPVLVPSFMPDWRAYGLRGRSLESGCTTVYLSVIPLYEISPVHHRGDAYPKSLIFSVA